MDPQYKLMEILRDKEDLQERLSKIDKAINYYTDRLKEINLIEIDDPEKITKESLKRLEEKSTFGSDKSWIALIDTKSGRKHVIYTSGYHSISEDLDKDLKLTDIELAAIHRLGYIVQYHIIQSCN